MSTPSRRATLWVPQVSLLRPGLSRRRRFQVVPELLALLTIFTLFPFTACTRVAAAPHTPTDTGPLTLHIEPTPLHTGVKRLGINLSGQTFYDSGQMLRNLTFRNPGFEGETWQSILHCKQVTRTSCTDENQYAQWPAAFLDGATYEILNHNHTGTVAHSTAAAGTNGVTLEFADTPALAAGDFVEVHIAKAGTAEAGWWKDLHNGATLATETHDLSPHTAGTQALRIEAAAPSQSATVSSFFDSFAGRSFVQLHGRYTLSFRAKALAGSPTVAVDLKRLDTTHGAHTFLHRDLPLTQAWHDYTFDLTANDIPNALGTVGLSFTFTGTSALLDDVSLVEAAAPGNPTAFRNAVVDSLRALHPGVLRYMDNGTDFGSSLDNMLAPPFARRRTGSSEQTTLQEDIPLGLHEFLTLCQAVGAEPWYSMPPGTSPAEAAALLQYLAADARTPYGARRAALGQSRPWTEVFPTIHLELGNEQWNARSFAGSTINNPTAYGQRAAEIFKSMRATPSFTPARFNLILGSWATVPWWTGEELKASASHDSIAVAPYLFAEFNDASSNEAVFGPMFAQPESLDSRPGGAMAQQLAATGIAGRHTNLAVYEVNLGTMSGSVAQADIDRTVPSLGAGLAVADHMLLMLRDLGVTVQCLFALPEFVNDFTSTNGGPKKTIPLWGAVADMGGPTNLRRPQFLAEQLANAAILPTMLATRLTGAQPMWNQRLSANSKIQLTGAHQLQTFAFADGPRRSLILLNLSRTTALTLRFDPANAPTGEVLETLLTAPAIDATNERSEQVTLRKHPLPRFNPAAPYTLPPFSMTTLIWTATNTSH